MPALDLCHPLRIASLVVATFLAPLPMAAQLLGAEFRVNSYTTGDQAYPAISSDASGNFVVVWKSVAQDGSGSGIFAQRFENSGLALGGEFQVNSYTTLDQYAPAVASDAAGNFLVVWLRGPDGGGHRGLFAQRFDASGSAAGTEFQVNVVTTGQPARPAATADGLGNFIVVWQDEEVIARRFGTDGTPESGELRVNTETSDSQGEAAVAADAAGNFVVVWDSYGQDGSSYGIFGQRFDVSGSAMGSEFQVNTYTTSWQGTPAVAMTDAGEFVAVWNRDHPGLQGSDIVGQRFDAAGSPLGGEFQASGLSLGFKGRPAVALAAAGSFVVTWDAPGRDGSGAGVLAQEFDSTGAKAGGEFRVNSYTPASQAMPVLAAGADGTFVAAWQSDSSQDGMGSGVFAQRLATLPFLDGFESGATCAWTAAVGGGCP